jgi:DNA-binding GntR family transcriptional regulator
MSSARSRHVSLRHGWEGGQDALDDFTQVMMVKTDLAIVPPDPATTRTNQVPYFVTKLDLAEQLLIRAIASGEIAPGEPLRQLELADRLGVSATPVREALRRLEAQGLVVRHPHRGVRVAQVKPEEMTELYIIRASLEGLAVEHAVPNLTKKDIEALEQIHRRLDSGRERGALKGLRKLNYEFHTTLYQHSELPRLIRIIDSLWPLFPWDSIWAIPGRADSSAAEHREILAALHDRDATAAGDAMRRHIESGAEALIKFHASVAESGGQSQGGERPRRSRANAPKFGVPTTERAQNSDGRGKQQNRNTAGSAARQSKPPAARGGTSGSAVSQTAEAD